MKGGERKHSGAKKRRKSVKTRRNVSVVKQPVNMDWTGLNNCEAAGEIFGAGGKKELAEQSPFPSLLLPVRNPSKKRKRERKRKGADIFFAQFWGTIARARQES